MKENRCSFCGTLLDEGQTVCPTCSRPVKDMNTTVNSSLAGKSSSAKSKILIACVATLLVLVCVGFAMWTAQSNMTSGNPDMIMIDNSDYYEQTMRQAVIDDKDGYTNVHEHKSLSSAKTDKIMEDEVFYTKKSTTEDWWPIYKTKDAPCIGFMHKEHIAIRGERLTHKEQAKIKRAQDEESIKTVVTDIIGKAVSSTNAFYNAMQSDGCADLMSDREILSYCSTGLKKLYNRAKAIERYYEETNDSRLDEFAGYFYGDGPDSLFDYLLHVGDDDFAIWDEVCFVTNWDIRSLSFQKDGDAECKVSLTKKSCYDGHTHVFVSTISLTEQNHRWLIYDMNGYRDNETIVRVMEKAIN